MSGDRSNDDILDEARHEQIIEQEEKIHREHPVLVRLTEELTARVKELEQELAAKQSLLKLRDDLMAVEVRRVRHFEHELQMSQEEVERLRLVIKQTPPPPAPERPRSLPRRFSAGVCNQCHQRILWGVTKNGKNIPLQTKPTTGELIDWSRELESELKDRGIELRRGYDEFGDLLTVALVSNPDPGLARSVYPVHFQSCTARNMSSNGGSTPT